MRRPNYSFFVTALLCAGLFAGCEWTGSDSESSWSGSYDDMNFSGTYRIDVNLEGESGSQDPSTTEKIRKGVGTLKGDSETKNTRVAYSGYLNPHVVPKSLGIRVAEYTFSDKEGDNALLANKSGASGTIQYDSGFWTITLSSGTVSTPTITDGEKIEIGYSYIEYIEGETGGAVGNDEAKTLKAITVTQTGQNLTMIFSNGLTMTGKFTQVNESGGEGGTTYNAGFEVSSSGNKFVGTLNNAGGRRVINGTWISGRSHFDVNGIAN